MEIDGERSSHEERIEDYARRSAESAETIQSGVMLLLAVVIVGLLIGAAALFAG